jgi:tripartite-type tricarboxylate transporter receptor subunit TctC
MRLFILIAALCVLLDSGVSAAASDYPTRPVKVVVPYAPGGGLDVVGRPLLKKLGEALQQQFILENRPGAGTTIGSAYVARAAPDGYTLLLTLRALSISPSIYKNMTFDPEKDLEPISLVTRSGDILCVHPSVPARNLKQLIAYARTHAGKLNYSSSGTGSDLHLTVAMFQEIAGIKMTHIPFTGGGPGFTALISGEVDAMLVPGSFGFPFIKAGKVRPLAVDEPSRSSNLPNVPTFKEEGFDGVSGSWSALFAPKGTSREIVMKLNAEVGKALENSEMRSFYLERFLVPLAGTPETLAEWLHNDISRWRKLVQNIEMVPQ